MPTITEINQALIASGNRMLNLTDVNLAASPSYEREAIYEMTVAPGVRAILVENTHFLDLHAAHRARFLSHVNAAAMLIYVRLRGNDATQNTSAFSDAVRTIMTGSSLRTLDLSNNRLGSLTDTELTQMFRIKTNLTHLDLSDNELTEEQVSLIIRTLNNSEIGINLNPGQIVNLSDELQIPAAAHAVSAEEISERINYNLRNKISRALRTKQNLSVLTAAIAEAKQHSPSFFSNQENCNALLTQIFSANRDIKPLLDTLLLELSADMIYTFLQDETEQRRFSNNHDFLPPLRRVELLRMAIDKNDSPSFNRYWNSLPTESRTSILDGRLLQTHSNSTEFNQLLGSVIELKVTTAVREKNLAAIQALGNEFGTRFEAVVGALLLAPEPNNGFKAAFLQLLKNQECGINCGHGISNSFKYLVTLTAKMGFLTLELEAVLEQYGNRHWRTLLPSIKADLALGRLEQLGDADLPGFIATTTSVDDLKNPILLNKILAQQNPQLLVALLQRIPADSLASYFNTRVNFPTGTLPLFSFLTQSSNGDFIKAIWAAMPQVLLSRSLDLTQSAGLQESMRQLRSIVGDDAIMTQVLAYLQREPQGPLACVLAEQVLMQIPMTHPGFSEFMLTMGYARVVEHDRARMAFGFLKAFQYESTLVAPGQTLPTETSTANTLPPVNNGVMALHVIAHWAALPTTSKNQHFAALTPEHQINLLATAHWAQNHEFLTQCWGMMVGTAQKTVLTDEKYAALRHSPEFRQAYATYLQRAINTNDFSALITLNADARLFSDSVETLKFATVGEIESFIRFMHYAITARTISDDQIVVLTSLFRLAINANLLDYRVQSLNISPTVRDMLAMKTGQLIIPQLNAFFTGYLAAFTEPGQVHEYINSLPNNYWLEHQLLFDKIMAFNNPELLRDLLTTLSKGRSGIQIAASFARALPVHRLEKLIATPAYLAVLGPQEYSRILNAFTQSAEAIRLIPRLIEAARGIDEFAALLLGNIGRMLTAAAFDTLASELIKQVPITHPQYQAILTGILDHESARDKTYTAAVSLFINQLDNETKFPTVFNKLKQLTITMAESGHYNSRSPAASAIRLMNAYISRVDTELGIRRALEESVRQRQIAEAAHQLQLAQEEQRRKQEEERARQEEATRQQQLALVQEQERAKQAEALREITAIKAMSVDEIQAAALQTREHPAAKQALCFQDIYGYLQNKYTKEAKGHENSTYDSKWTNYVARLDHLTAIMKFIETNNHSRNLGAELIAYIDTLPQPATNRSATGILASIGVKRTADNYKHLIDTLKEVATQSPDILVTRCRELSTAIQTEYPEAARSKDLTEGYPGIALYKRLELGNEINLLDGIEASKGSVVNTAIRVPSLAAALTDDDL